MAWQTTGYVLRVNLVDSGNNEVSKTYVMTTAIPAESLTDALVIINALEAVCALATKTYAITETFYNDAFALPVAGVQAEAKAVLIMTDGTLPNKQHRTEIPGPETDVFLATTGDGANIVATAHQDVLDYVNLYDGTGEATLSDGESVVTDGIIKGYRRTAGKKRG